MSDLVQLAPKFKIVPVFFVYCQLKIKWQVQCVGEVVRTKFMWGDTITSPGRHKIRRNLKKKGKMAQYFFSSSENNCGKIG